MIVSKDEGVFRMRWILLRDAASLLLKMRFDTFETKERPSRSTAFTHISGRGAVTPVGARNGATEHKLSRCGRSSTPPDGVSLLGASVSKGSLRRHGRALEGGSAQVLEGWGGWQSIRADPPRHLPRVVPNRRSGRQSSRN